MTKDYIRTLSLRKSNLTLLSPGISYLYFGEVFLDLARPSLIRFDPQLANIVGYREVCHGPSATLNAGIDD